jgi:hypothetical protein
MIDYLKEIFTDPFKQRTADRQFKDLIMQKDEAFHDFYTLFLKTAAKAKVLKVSYQSKLWNKITVSLTYAVIAFEVNYKTYQELATYLMGLDYTQRRLKAITSAKKAARPKPSSSSTTNIPLRSANTYSRSATPRGDAPRASENTALANITFPIYWTEERTKLYDEGRCFIYKAKDHLGKDCPVQAARQERRDRRIAIVEANGNDNDNQGKGSS